MSRKDEVLKSLGINIKKGSSGKCRDGFVDAIYIALTTLKPEGVIEVAEGINIDVTEDGKIVGIELLDASEKVSIDTLLTYEIAAESVADWVIVKNKASASLLP